MDLFSVNCGFGTATTLLLVPIEARYWRTGVGNMHTPTVVVYQTTTNR